MNKASVLGMLAMLLQSTAVLSAATRDAGDQILNGIGETALLARYVFNGNAYDTSRNSQHAKLEGSGITYVDDARFGKVLSLPGGTGGYVQIPGRVFDGLDTISVSGWIMVRQVEDAPFFDFGQSSQQRFFCMPCGKAPLQGYVAGVTASGHAAAERIVAPAVPTNQWVHLAIVFEPIDKTITTYLDGQPVKRASINSTFDRLINQTNANLNHAFIGADQDTRSPRLNALVHDFRIYSIALSEKQVADIYGDVAKVDDRRLGGSTGDEQTDHKPAGMAQPMASSLVGVDELTVTTSHGVLPHLPARVRGIYRGNAIGPDVRVIWPAPQNNRQTVTNHIYSVTGEVPGTDLHAKATVIVEASLSSPSPKHQIEPFALGAVTLLQDNQHRDTQFMKNRDKFIHALAKTDPDRFLYMFRNAFGQPQPKGAEPLGVWDSQTTKLRGHATGHYLTALAQAYASSESDPQLHREFGEKLNYMVDFLYRLSRLSGTPTNPGAAFNADPAAVPPAPGRSGYNSDLSESGIRSDYWNWGKGFISAYPPDQFIMLEQGAVYGGGDKQIWAPYYTLHKLLAGLLDCYELAGNQKALIIAGDMARWVHQRLDRVPEKTRVSMWNRYIAGEYGGMNEVLARLSRITGDKSFLECAKLFDNVEFFFGDSQHSSGLAHNVDTLRGKHSNQHIPQIIGALETYRDIHQNEYWNVAANFWEICRHSYMYSIGGVAGARNPNNAECFTAHPDSLFADGFSDDGQNETCATYNLLKLSRQLFMFEPDAKYMDYYEQALYNHILSSVASDDPGNTYHVPLNPGARKQFSNAGMDGFTCCNGTALESNTKLQDSIYFKSADDQALYVNLYVPSKLNWAARQITLTQETDFPYADSTRLHIVGQGRFDLKMRVPGWAHEGVVVKINGRRQTLAATPGTYLTLTRNWKDGDTIDLQMPFAFHLMPVMDQPNIASLFYGPVLLAAEENEPRSTWRKLALNGEHLGRDIVGDPRTLHFSVGDASLKPFYECYGRYSVYLDVTLK